MIKVKEQETFQPDFGLKRYRLQSQIITSETLQRSLEVLSKFDYNIQKNKTEYKNKLCQCCNSFFPVADESKCVCNLCAQEFCSKHRDPLNHNCGKLSPNQGKYLMAKNLFREKMKMMKYKRS